jgi:activator of 2-hydroxyglutaryl-CoA dehydratase
LKPNILNLGIDVGSTTTKAVLIDPQTQEILFSNYARHCAHQTQSVSDVLAEIERLFPHISFEIAICGSGGLAQADLIGAHYVQEVVANSVAIQNLYTHARTAIELGGQDAKVIFLSNETATNRLTVSDMRMNGSCAGGTGAFLDEMAMLLKVPVQEFEALAQKGRTVYDISGRCGVYAKTDIQPLLNKEYPKKT